MRIMKLLFLSTAILSLNVVLAQETETHDDIQTVESSDLRLPKIQVVPIKDTKTNSQYELYIKLPEDYAENKDANYPVLYTTDAMWHIEMLSGATEYLMENAILVGISWQKDISEALKQEAGEHVSRYRDYSVIESSNLEHQAKYQFGQASSHLDFIRDDVIEYVENNYRTDPDNRSYFGYSLGGLFGAYILLKQPDTFKNYLLGSPSLGGDIPYLSELASHLRSKLTPLNANVFISYGTLEKELGEHAEAFIIIVKNINDESLIVRQEVMEGTHQTVFPMTVVRSIAWLSINQY
ncbi:alpha/beta hydrolase-fold protein [Fulvivirga sp.]|uniref:alpha/beta hydrolase n=1 Tax=Fulvivirga sp. TaxID=1931237 RepID=UPI0032ED3806